MVSPTLRQFPLYYRVLLHLMRHDLCRDEDTLPREFTTLGVADAIGRDRASTSIVIRDMVSRGWLTFDVHRASGGRSIKCAMLTNAGRMEAARAERIALSLGCRADDVIRAPATANADIISLLRRFREIEDQLNDLRRRIESLSKITDNETRIKNPPSEHLFDIPMEAE